MFKDLFSFSLQVTHLGLIFYYFTLKLGSEKGSHAITLMLADARLQSRSKTHTNMNDQLIPI